MFIICTRLKKDYPYHGCTEKAITNARKVIGTSLFLTAGRNYDDQKLTTGMPKRIIAFVSETCPSIQV